jgi:hypothetical protein
MTHDTDVGESSLLPEIFGWHRQLCPVPSLTENSRERVTFALCDFEDLRKFFLHNEEPFIHNARIKQLLVLFAFAVNVIAFLRPAINGIADLVD